MAQCSASFPFYFLEKYRNYHRAIFLVTSQVEKLLIRVWNHLLVIWWNKHVLFFVDEKIATFLWLSLDVYKKSKREVNLKGFLEYWIPSVKHSQLCPASRSWCLGESKRRLEKSPLRLLSLSVKFVGSLLCSERFFSGNSGFPLSSKTNIWFDLIYLIYSLPN